MTPECGDAQRTVGPERDPGRFGDHLRLRDERGALRQFARVCVQEDAGPDREGKLTERPASRASLMSRLARTCHVSSSHTAMAARLASHSQLSPSAAGMSWPRKASSARLRAGVPAA